MAQATVAPSIQSEARQKNGHRRSIVFILTVFVVGVVVLGAVVLVLCRHAFSQRAVLKDLREASDSQVEARSFRQLFFPVPGCVLEGVVFRHGLPQVDPLISVEKLIVRGSYLGLLSTHVDRMTAEGMRVSIPAFGTGQHFHTAPSQITVEEFIANGARVEFASSYPDQPPLRFDVREATLRNVAPHGPFSFRVKVHNPKPPGEVSVAGKFGEWNKADPGQTPIAGEYTFEQADLSVYEGVAGKLFSTGKFVGTLGHIDIAGATDTPDFEVKSAKHPVRLTSEFTAYVDATRGDTFLKHVRASFSKTHVEAEGSIAGTPNGNGKTALINLTANDAHMEDILRLFDSESRPPMSGSVTLHARTEIPPSKEEFLKKVKIGGNFGIGSGTFSKSVTQEGVNKLSAGARGEKDPGDPEMVLVDLTGQVSLLGGTARFSDLAFGVPGASARMRGTYDLLNHRIDLRGQMQVDSKISNTESGPKALLLKAIEPFFKKKKKGEIVPVRISGTYEQPRFGLDLNDKKGRKVPDPVPKP